MNDGQLKQNPPGELFREISQASLSGALRLAADRAKVIVYFNDGHIIFAASNVRSHRLVEILKRNGVISNEQLGELPANDDQLADLLLQRGTLTAATLLAVRTNQVSDILRIALLWTEGSWQFDQRVRIAAENRVAIDLKSLLLDSARHLPPDYIASRFAGNEETIDVSENNGHEVKLRPSEAFVLSRINARMTLGELQMISGLPECDTRRAVYGLSLCGLLRRSIWPASNIKVNSSALVKKYQKLVSPPVKKIDEPAPTASNEPADLDALFARLEKTDNYYDILGLEKQATIDQVKNTYHSLARRYHPDLFHQSEAKLRSRVDSAFARIARAYETLSDEALRVSYDAQYSSKSTGSGSVIDEGRGIY